MGQHIELSFRVSHALLLTFVIGAVTGGFMMGTIQGVTGTPTGATAAQPSGSDTGGNQPSPNPSPSPAGGSGGSDSVSTSDIDLKNDPAIGPQDAPVTVVAWEDYQCPFCKRFEQQSFPQIKENYINEGKVRFVFKDFAFLGEDSTTGAVASQCVWRQVGNDNPSAWDRWKAAMFDNQDGENRGWGARSDIISMTRNISGVNADTLRSCMENNREEIQQELSTDKSQGRNVGISGTPGFVIYKSGSDTGTKIVGAQPYSRFQSVIDQKLNGGGTQESGGTQEPDKTIEVSGTEYSFSPSTITVQKDQTVRVEFTNTGQIPHNLRIPSLGVGSQVIQGGQTDSFTFTAPEEGTYPINTECTLPGHAENGMVGEVVVK